MCAWSRDDVHVSRPSGKGAESRCEEDANVSNVDGEVQGLQEVVDDTAGGHQARVDGTADDSPERVPCCWVEPIPEFLHAGGQNASEQ